MHKESRELKDMPIVDIEKGKAKGDERSGKPNLKDLQSKEGSGPRVGDVKPGTITPTGGSPYGDKKDAKKEQPKSTREYGSPAKAAKPDYPDIDKDGDTSESMKKAAADKKKGSPAKKYDRVVLGGNKGDKSKTKPGKKDYEK